MSERYAGSEGGGRGAVIPVSVRQERRRRAEARAREMVLGYDPEKQAALEEMLYLTMALHSGSGANAGEKEDYIRKMDALYTVLCQDAIDEDKIADMLIRIVAIMAGEDNLNRSGGKRRGGRRA